MLSRADGGQHDAPRKIKIVNRLSLSLFFSPNIAGSLVFFCAQVASFSSILFFVFQTPP